MPSGKPLESPGTNITLTHHSACVRTPKTDPCPQECQGCAFLPCTAVCAMFSHSSRPLFSQAVMSAPAWQAETWPPFLGRRHPACIPHRSRSITPPRSADRLPVRDSPPQTGGSLDLNSVSRSPKQISVFVLHTHGSDS